MYNNNKTKQNKSLFLFINGMSTWRYSAMIIFLAQCMLHFASFLLWIFFLLCLQRRKIPIYICKKWVSVMEHTLLLFFSPAVALGLWVYVYCLIDTHTHTQKPKCLNAENQSLFQPVLEYWGSVEGNIYWSCFTPYSFNISPNPIHHQRESNQFVLGC